VKIKGFFADAVQLIGLSKNLKEIQLIPKLYMGKTRLC
jgi:hypothetical protein